MNKVAKELREQFLGDRHLETADSYHDLALNYYEQKNYDEALKLNEKSLKIKLNFNN